MTVPFSELFKKKNTDLMRPCGGKYPAISTDIDRSMVNLSSDPTNTPVAIDPTTVNPNNPLLYMDFDEMIARETAQAVAEMEPHSFIQFAVKPCRLSDAIAASCVWLGLEVALGWTVLSFTSPKWWWRRYKWNGYWF
jgi:hypothetical protein